MFTRSAPVHILPTSAVFLSVFTSLSSVCLPTHDTHEYTYTSAHTAFPTCAGRPCVCHLFGVGGHVHPVLTVPARAACGVSSAAPTPTAAPKAAGTSTLPPPQSLPEKQKRARDAGGGQSPRHSRTSDVRSAPPRVPPTSSQPCPIHPSPTPQPSTRGRGWRVAVCTHRKPCLARGLLQPPSLIPSPQQ